MTACKMQIVFRPISPSLRFVAQHRLEDKNANFVQCPRGVNYQCLSVSSAVFKVEELQRWAKKCFRVWSHCCKTSKIFQSCSLQLFPNDFLKKKKRENILTAILFTREKTIFNHSSNRVFLTAKRRKKLPLLLGGLKFLQKTYVLNK